MNSDMTEVTPPGGLAMHRGVSASYSETGPRGWRWAALMNDSGCHERNGEQTIISPGCAVYRWVNERFKLIFTMPVRRFQRGIKKGA